LGVVNGDYDEVKTITNTAIATNKTLTITGLLTYRYDTFLFEILDQSDVTIGESSIDLDVVSEVSTMEFVVNDYYSFEFAKYFLNGYGDVPYVELTDFYNHACIKLIDDGIGRMHKNDGYYDELGIFLYFGDDLTGENQYQIAVDPSTDEMWVLQDIPGGIFNNNSHTYNDMEYMGDGIETALCMIDTENSRHLSDRFQGYYDFARYNLDIVVDKNNVVYFPLLAVNYIFNEAVGYPLVYNGEDLYFAFNIYDDDDTNPGFCKVIDDSVGNRFVSECPWLEDNLVSEEYATHAYNCFCLALEECYGLSYHRGIIDINDPDKSADSYLNDLGYKTSTKFLSNDIALFEDSFATFVGNIYYDGHSGYLSPSVALENDNKQLFTQAYSAARSNNNERYNSLMSTYHELDEARKTSSRQIGLNVYEDTAIIVFDGFEKYYEYNGGYLPDASKDIALNHLDEYSYEELHEIGTDLLFRKAFNEIEANPDIENVVFDISMNGGGMVDSLPFLEAYMSDDPHITMNNKFDGGCNEIHYKVDINYDGVFDENDTYKGQYNFYLLTSNYSFSCGNYFPTVIKEMGAATLFGERSGGGACAVGYLSTPYGGLLRNSSNFQLGHWDYDNEEFINNDDGIEVDYAFDRQYFYDDQEIYNFVHAHQ